MQNIINIKKAYHAKWIVIYLLALFINRPEFAYAKNYAFFFGGDSIDSYAQKSFYSTTLEFTAALSRSSEAWETHIHFNGSQEQFSDIQNLTDSKKINLASFTNEFTYKNSYLTEKRYIKRLTEENQWQPGDKLLIAFTTHGSPPEEGKQITHSIMAGNYVELFIDLDGLKVLIDTIPSFVKINVIDLSCRGGASLAMAKENICVIGGSGRTDLYYTDFGPLLFLYFSGGQNLEDIFLSAKTDYKGPSRAEISTLENRMATQTINGFVDAEKYYLHDSYLTSLFSELHQFDGKIADEKRQGNSSYEIELEKYKVINKIYIDLYKKIKNQIKPKKTTQHLNACQNFIF